MSNFNVDLSNCDREPIHIPGQIQFWGCLVVVNANTNLISYVSSNIIDFFQLTPCSILGQNLIILEKKISTPDRLNPLSAFVEAAKIKNDPEAYPITVEGRVLDLLIHTDTQFVFLEFESKEESSTLDIHNQIGRHVSTVLAASQLNEILSRAAAVIKELINYDRVMIYQFLEDAHGKVVAEAKNKDLDPFLNLHYPASDIPAQARELYKQNKVRLIADVNSHGSAIMSLSNNPVDLSQAVLRAVSPMHIQYLKNMGVSSSFSISLMCKSELWGLIACHNYSPKFINHKVRNGAALLGQIISSSIEFKEEEIINAAQKFHKATFDKIISDLHMGADISTAVLNSSASLLNILKAEGVYMRYEGTAIKDGTTPSESEIEEIIHWLGKNSDEQLFQTNKLVDHIPSAIDYSGTASGILVCTLSKELKEYIIWFRPEITHNITWAGNPEKPVEYNEDGVFNISPRKSFESFSQTVRGSADRWKLYEQNIALRFKEELLFIINKKASEIRVLNEKLRDAYEELETFSSTISHDLKTPIAAIKSYAQLLERNKTLDDVGKNFAARISHGASKMNFLIAEVLEYSRLGRSKISFEPVYIDAIIGNIKTEITAAYNLPDLILKVGDTPLVFGDEVMLYQVFQNLISNAVKYSLRSTPPVVTIEGSEDDYQILYKIQDNGVGIDEKNFSRVFELFKRVNISDDFEGTGVGLAIVKRIVDKHKASIWIESTVGEGSIFWLKFRKFQD